ncbi:hypothetical protein BDV93DRAFT_217727 [Ceratobasidium sp. AG-I]|nr:hypothetical protein BDV93DRAFT_217727 [Ceratobasidium sp. AG-I]
MKNLATFARMGNMEKPSNHLDLVFQQPPDSSRSIAAHLHNATIVLQDKRKHAQLLKKAEHRAENKGRRGLKDTLAQLQLLGVLKLGPEQNLKELTVEELETLAQEHETLLRLTVIDLNHKRDHFNCKACPPKEKRLQELCDPKLLPFPSAIAPVPSLFTSGAVRFNQVKAQEFATSNQTKQFGAPQDSQAHEFTILTHGSICGIVKSDTGTNEIGLGVWFRESEDMDPFELANLPMVAEKFHKAIHLCSKVTNNGAMLSGDMAILGWTGGYMAGTAYHLYVPPPRSRKDGTMEEWIKLQKESDLIRQFFNTQFEKFALAITTETHQAIKDLGVPVFGVCQTEPEVQGPSLGSNFSVSRNLVNKMHCDNDAHKYVFSLYLFCDSNGILVTDRSRISACMKGGYFIWPDLHLGIDPSACGGVVFFLWRGIYERHGTMTAVQLDANLWRYGCSMQVNQHLVDKIRIAKERGTMYTALGLSEHTSKYGPK